MKLTKIALAVSAVTLSGSAFALSSSTTSYDIDLLVSGATAQENQIEAAFFGYCDLGTADKYTIDNDDKRGWAITCTSNSSAPGGAGLDMILRKQNGGSSDGVEEPSFGQNLDVVAVDTACTASTLLENGVQDHDCPNDETIPTQVGISDVEPALFAATINGPKAVNASATWAIAPSPTNVSTFGVVVSPGLYRALQTAQGLNTANNTTGNNVANMPSLSSALVANLMAGNVPEWSLLNDAGGPITASAGLTSEKVNLCVRKPGSGTQAQFAAFYLQNPCLGAGGKAFALDSDNSITSGSGFTYPAPNLYGFEKPGPHVFYNDGSSDLGRCMTHVAARNAWAIGFQAVEKVAEDDTSKNDYKFVKVDGVAPTLENVAAGLYRNWSSPSYQVNSNATGAELTLATDLLAKLRAKADVEVNNNTFKPVAYDPLVNIPTIINGSGNPADVGNLALAGIAGNGDAVSPFDPTNPVMPYNKGTSSLNTCSVPNIAGGVVDVSVQ